MRTAAVPSPGAPLPEVIHLAEDLLVLHVAAVLLAQGGPAHGAFEAADVPSEVVHLPAEGSQVRRGPKLLVAGENSLRPRLGRATACLPPSSTVPGAAHLEQVPVQDLQAAAGTDVLGPRRQAGGRRGRRGADGRRGRRAGARARFILLQGTRQRLPIGLGLPQRKRDLGVRPTGRRHSGWERGWGTPSWQGSPPFWLPRRGCPCRAASTSSVLPPIPVLPVEGLPFAAASGVAGQPGTGGCSASSRAGLYLRGSSPPYISLVQTINPNFVVAIETASI